MDKRIQISVIDKIAKQTCDTVYVCGNSDYVVDFSFDSDWDEYLVKTARFITGDSRVFDVVFEGDSCEVPTISKTHVLHVGVFAGELCTTTAAKVLARKSILCDDGSPEEPAPDVYAQIMDKLNAGIGSKNLFDGRAVGSVRMKAAKEDVGYQAIALNMAKASGQNAFASGDSEASGLWAHAENGGNASGYMAHAENRSEAKGRYSHGEGDHTIASGDSQHAQGRYNVEDTEGRYAHIVGNGNGQSQSNAHTLDWHGNAWFAGDVYVGGKSQDEAEKLVKETEIPTVINDALAQAKASGEFDGKDGAPGANGKDGYTPVKGVDYFDGKDGAPGSAGRDGTSVTITNVTESNTDGGNNVITFSDGKKLVVKNGKTGASGKDGYTPVKGVDYFDGKDGVPGADGKNYVLTEADKKEIAGMIEVPEGEGGSSLPTGEAPYQQLVTDADGNAVWEDKPFGEQNGVILTETEIDGESENMVTLNAPLVAEEAYEATVNGTVYECVAFSFEFDGSPAIGLGDAGFMGSGEPTPGAPPFLLIQLPVMTAAMMLNGSPGTLAISGKSIKKLNPKYIDLAWMAEDKAVGETIVPLTVHTDDKNYERFSRDLASVLVAEKDLVVLHNDRLYETTLTDVGGYIIGGNTSIVSDNFADTGEPFYFMITSDLAELVFKTSDACLYAIYAVGDVQKIPVKLPEKYAPNGNAVFYVETTQSGSANNIYPINKTYEEILIAYVRGYQVIFRHGRKLYYLSIGIGENGNAVFTAFDGDTMTVSPDSVATYTKNAITYASEVEW